MSLRRFLDIAYFILIEEYQRLGMNLTEALDKNMEYRAQTFKKDVDPSEEAVARQNEAAMKALKEQLKGTGLAFNV